PVMSLGTKSGVNWMRRNSRCTASASDLTMSVFARPGTPTSSACPPAINAIRISSSTCSCPTMRRCTSARSCAAAPISASRACAGGAIVMWQSANRPAAPERQQKDRSVDDADVGERSSFVEHFPTAQLEHEVRVELALGLWIEGAKCGDLGDENRLGGRDANADDVP